jgi:hypothetical protein
MLACEFIVSMGGKEIGMSNITKFPQAVASKLGYYVYLYIDPETQEVIYVGKGKGNRCFAHLDGKYDSPLKKKLSEMQKRGVKPQIQLLAHELEDEAAALTVEAAVIDLLGVPALANSVHGHHSNHKGRMTLEEVMAIHDRKPAKISEKAILIRINRLYRYGMSPGELYDATRGTWKIGQRRDQADYAIAVYQNIIREVYKIAHWLKSGSTFIGNSPEGDTATGRWEFVGTRATEDIRKKHVGRSVDHCFAKYSANPIQYVNC